MIIKYHLPAERIKKATFNLLIVIAILSSFSSSCNKKDKQQSDDGPKITTFQPTEGNEGTVVTVNGFNFSTTASENSIGIAGVDVIPLSSTSVQLQFKIPAGINPGNYQVSVSIGDLNATSSQYFKITEKDASITDPDVINFNYTIGAQTIGPSYSFTGDDRLVETAKALIQMGSNILKISLSPGSYNISGRSYSNITALVRDDPSFSAVLDMPFTYYFFWARSHANWADGYSASERNEDSVQIADLTKFLLTKYNNTGKQFFIGHWEGDWYLLPNYDVNYVPSDSRIQGMIQWYIARQNAVDEANRVTQHNNIFVYTYCEVNRVVDAINGLRRVVNYVLPYTNVDYVSYSSYDAQGLSQQEYTNVLNYIEANLPPRPQITGKRVFIGEMGRCAQDFSFSKPQHESVNRDNIRKALSWGTPFVLYWEMYNNEIQNGVQRGFWLIDNANTRWPLYDTYYYFYTKAKKWVASQKKALNRLPSREEYLAWAYMTLANPY